MPKRRRVGSVGTEKVTEKEHNSDSENPGPSNTAVPSDNAENQGALTNHLILKEVFKHLPVDDLLNFSLVNSFWNSCARSVLRENKKCVAFIRRDNMCLNLKDLNDLLENAVNIPFNGLSIQSNSGYNCLHSIWESHCRILKNPSTIYSNLFDMVTFKYFDIKLGDDNDYWRGDKCPGLKIIQDIIKNSAEKLEGLSVPYFIDELVSHTLDLNVQDFYFPKLKYLQMPTVGRNVNTSGLFEPEDYSYIGRQLLQAAPNVKNITGWVSPLHLELLAEQNQLNAVREFNFEFQEDLILEPEPENPDDEDSDLEEKMKHKREYTLEQLLHLSQDYAGSLKNLTKLSISTAYFPRDVIVNKEKWFPMISDIYTRLLSNSSDTLQELRIFQLDLVLLSRLKLQPLHRVRSIELIYVPHLSWTLTTFNWSQLFPNVTSVTIAFEKVSCPSEEVFDRFYTTEQMYESKSIGNESCTWSSVTDLTYDASSDKASTYYLYDHPYSHIFPNIKNVTFREWSPVENGVAAACTILWTAWPELVSIAFLDLPQRIMNKCFDHCFTGMTEDQSKIVRNAILNGKDVSDLIEKYQTQPSIRNLTKLKSFRVTFCHERTISNNCCRDPVSSENFFITVVTKKCALDLMPSLDFEIRGNAFKIPGKECCYTMKHLEPNAER